MTAPPADAGNAAAGSSLRIVSLVPSITELLFDLGLGRQVAGRTRFCVHPRAQVAQIPRVGGTKDVRMERLRGLAPTHVVVNVDENRVEDAAEIATFSRLVVTHPLQPLDNLVLYRLLGATFDCHAAARALCDRFERAYAELRERALQLPARRVLYLIWHDPWMTVSADTYIARVLELVNWRVAGGEGTARYPQVTVTPELMKEVDLVLFSSEPFPFKERHLQSFRARSGCRRDQLAPIDGEMTSWYGSRAIAGLEYIGRLAAELLERAA